MEQRFFDWHGVVLHRSSPGQDLDTTRINNSSVPRLQPRPRIKTFYSCSHPFPVILVLVSVNLSQSCQLGTLETTFCVYSDACGRPWHHYTNKNFLRGRI